MKKFTFERVNESIYYEKLSNGIDVYLYPTKKTKNFYISISVKYGARITKYKLNDKIYDIIPGSAHFLEHKVMALSENPEISKRINSLGSLANAWTSYYGTNYNIFGSIDIKENLKLLLDIFYNIDINPKCVEEEKGIIGEEIDMYKDQIDSYLYTELFRNLFNNSYVKNTVVGERSDIEKITAKSLNKVYNDFYTPNNTFIIVNGDFDKDEIMSLIKEYMSKLNFKEKALPKRIKEKEKETVKTSYMEVSKNMNATRVKYALKIPKKIFNIKNEVILRYYLSIILSSNFSASSPLFERYKKEGIIRSISSGINFIDDYIVININALCNDGNLFIENIKKDIKNLTIDSETFERKRKLFLKSYIMDFDNIEDVEYNICNSLLIDGKINFKEYTDIINMTYEETKRILSLINTDNVSIIRTIK